MADGGSFQDTGSREALINGVRSSRANALHWWPSEADMKLTGGLFAHPNDVPRTPENLMHHYDVTTGRNSLMLLNVPPTTTGKFAPESVAALEGFTAERRMVFAEDYALGLPVLANGTAETTITDGNGYTSWSSGESGATTLELDLGATRAIDRVSLGEDVLNHGQTAEAFTVEAFVDGAWTEVAAAGSIGYNRSVTFDSVDASNVRVTVDQMRAPVHLATMSVYGKSEAVPAQPTDIYVDCSATVAGPGTKDRPFTTLEQFRQTEITPGTTIHFRSGTTCAESTTSYWGYGTAETPITVTTYDGGVEPTIGSTPASEVFSTLEVQGWAVDFSSDPGDPGDPGDPPVTEKPVSLSADVLRAGDVLTVTGKGFAEGEDVTFSARNNLRGEVAADSGGAAVFEWPVTSDTKPGMWNLKVSGEDGEKLRAKFRVLHK